MQGESPLPSILPGGSLLPLPPATSRRRRCPLIPSLAARHLLSKRAGPELGGGGEGGAVRENGISFFFECTSVRTPRQGIHLLRLYSCYVQLGCQAPPGRLAPPPKQVVSPQENPSLVIYISFQGFYRTSFSAALSPSLSRNRGFTEI